MTNKFIPYDIWYAYVKYDDASEEGKDRPVLIVETIQGLRVLVLSITSTLERDDDALVIEKWEAAGLEHKSAIRTNGIHSLKPKNFRKKIGSLHETDKLRLMLKRSE